MITTVTEDYDRIPPGCVNEVYEARMAEAFASAPLSRVNEVAFGDLFLVVLARGWSSRLRHCR